MSNAAELGPRQPRDPRLDFFRGIAMFIILIAHTPRNPLTLWIPARFGFSDATEIFVFCSGMASAIAFGRVFDNRGWWMGAARIAHRVWQVYWAHIAVFFVVAAMVSAATAIGISEKNYITGLNLQRFFSDTETNLIALLTLTYVPNYFDILPMYLAILAMVPLVMLLAERSLAAAGAFVAVLWLMANFGVLSLPAEPWSERQWFFNPFAWQLVFFTGFALMRGWIPAPPVRREYIIAAIVIAVITIPIAWFRIRNQFPELKEFRADLRPFTTKTNFGILRYIHFLSIAYLAWVAAGVGGRHLLSAGWWGRVVKVIQKVGQQSLAVFLVSIVAARALGMVLDVVGRDAIQVALVNGLGFAILIATAYLVAWFKGQPWRRPAPAPREEPAAQPQPEPRQQPADQGAGMMIERGT